MKLGLSALCALLVVGASASLQAKPPVTSGNIDLAVDSFTSKTKTKTKNEVTSLKNVTVYVSNLGDTDAKKARIDWYVSADDILTTATDNETTPADTLVHSQAIGTVKPGKLKKRTLGGGLLKNMDYDSSSSLFVVLDSTYVLDETNEENNVDSTPLP